MSAQQLSDFTDAAKIKLLEWRMAFVWFSLFSAVSLASATLGALTNANWSMMDTQGKVQMVLAIFVSWGTTMMAFFSKAAKKVEQQITPDSGTAFITRTDTQSQTVKVSSNPPAETPQPPKTP
jgi:hypothetical protein